MRTSNLPGGARPIAMLFLVVHLSIVIAFAVQRGKTL